MNTNLKPKLQRFASATAFACPICQENLTLVESSLKCSNRHSFDLAKFGYVNLAPQIKQSANYDKENFQNRQQILEAGFYQAILEAVSDLLASSETSTTNQAIGQLRQGKFPKSPTNPRSWILSGYFRCCI